MKVLIIILLALLACIVIYGLILLISAILVDKSKTYTKHSRLYRVILNSATYVVKVASNVSVNSNGTERLPKGRFLLICNHRSGYDPMLTYLHLKKYTLAFIAKPEIFKIPIFGRMIKRCCFLPIDREDPKKAMKSILQAAEILKDGQVSYGVYPEGTRSLDGKLLPFHNGVIKIAQKAKTPLVVATIRGTEKIKNRAPWRRTRVTIDILKVYSEEEVCSRRSAELGDECYLLMKKFLEDNNEG